MEKTRILFVCLGNICRSPSAEAVMNAMVEAEGLEDLILVDSAGVIGAHEGEPADGRMKMHASQRNYRLTSISRPVEANDDFERFDLVIGMDDQNIRDLKAMAPNTKALAKIWHMTDFCKAADVVEVPDPYYGGAEGFELVLDILEDACSGLIEKLKNGFVENYQ